MLLRVTDGQVQLATHKIKVTLDLQNEKNVNLATALSPYQTEEFGLVAYSIEEKDAILSVLSSSKLTHTTEQLTYADEVLNKVSTNTYNSRSEALGDLKGTNVIVSLESRLTATEDAILALMAGGMPLV